MKNLSLSLLLLVMLSSALPIHKSTREPLALQPAHNLIIITIDGFRWQEIFQGADEELINDPNFTPDTATTKMLYWSDHSSQRRQQLMPFFWNILSRKGQLYGNREFGNKVNTANLYGVSYPGYNEMFTGNTDLLIASNRKKTNTNRNVLEYLNGLAGFHDSIVAFTSWDVFPYILNERRSQIPINSGYEPIARDGSASFGLIDSVQSQAIYNKTGTRHDQLTYIAAREYLQQYHPRVLYLAFGEADEYAHGGRYDLYLQHANQVDRMIGELWQWIQTTPGYKNQTSLLITTDHGRGSSDRHWKSHGGFIKGSSQTWLALIGPGIKSNGEIRDRQQLYQQDLPDMMARLLGENFVANR